MIAGLPMYDLPALRAAHDRYWQAIRRRLGWGPAQLTRGGDPWVQWQHPDLVLSQTCGYPFRARLHGQVTLVGTPDHGLRGCAAGTYRSVFVARADDPRADVADFTGARFAFNEALSQSGWAAPMIHAQGMGLRFGASRETGSHAASARAVREGRADIAALDALTWILLQRHEGFADGLRAVGATSPTPALPYICASRHDGAVLFAAIAAAISDLDPADREALHLRGIVQIPRETYLSVATPPPPEMHAG